MIWDDEDQAEAIAYIERNWPNHWFFPMREAVAMWQWSTQGGGMRARRDMENFLMWGNPRQIEI